MPEETHITIPLSALKRWRDVLNEAMNPSVQFDRDNQVMGMRAYEARGEAVSTVLREIEETHLF